MAKAVVKSAPAIEPGNVETRMIALAAITGNTAQARGMGILPTLQEKGYGIFEKGSDEEKEPLWNLLFSNKPEERKEALHLIEENEQEFVDFTVSFLKTGQLQPIGVRQIDDQGYDIIYGMRRALAMACNFAKDTSRPNEIEAKVYTADMSPVQYKLMSFKENEERSDQTPIDKAMSFQWLQKAGKMSPDQIGAEIHLSGQSIRNHLKLLSPLLLDVRGKIHAGVMSIERALLLYDKRKNSDKDVSEEGVSSRNGEGDKQRFRLPTTKGLVKLYELGRKPKKMEQEEWDLWIKPDVRQLLAYKLNLKFSEFVGQPEEEEEKPKKKKGKVLRIKRSTAQHLLIALGKTQARTFSDETLKEMLESIPNVQESEDQTVETTRLQNLLVKLREGYTQDPPLKVEITEPDTE